MAVQPVDVTVTLTPAQARELAGTLRCELAMRWEQARLGAIPSREEIEQARSLLEHYGDKLERLKWGKPAGNVCVQWPADVLGRLAEDLQQSAEECYADAPSDARARDLRSTARTLATALQRGVAAGREPAASSSRRPWR